MATQNIKNRSVCVNNQLRLALGGPDVPKKERWRVTYHPKPRPVAPKRVATVFETIGELLAWQDRQRAMAERERQLIAGGTSGE